MQDPKIIGRDYAAAIDGASSVAEAAALYTDGLRTYGPSGIDWAQVNGAILNRWSMSTLTKIKRVSWKACRAPAQNAEAQ